jgi:hypothetical protein
MSVFRDRLFNFNQEGLANSFESMNLLEEALMQYDELEASFYQSSENAIQKGKCPERS